MRLDDKGNGSVRPSMDPERQPPWMAWPGGGTAKPAPRVLLFFFFFKILFVYSCETQREKQRPRQREKQAPRREPNVGLDPRTLGSGPDPKADAQPLSHPGVPVF